VGVLTIELHVEASHSLKDKRHVVKGLKDRLRHKFNVAVAEIDGMNTWQWSVLAAASVSADRAFCEKTLRAVEDECASVLGSNLLRADLELW
jgi:uncharacterized protein YlxP (DUF503 family)